MKVSIQCDVAVAFLGHRMNKAEKEEQHKRQRRHPSRTYNDGKLRFVPIRSTNSLADIFHAITHQTEMRVSTPMTTE